MQGTLKMSFSPTEDGSEAVCSCDLKNVNIRDKMHIFRLVCKMLRITDNEMERTILGILIMSGDFPEAEDTVVEQE